ncbi:MAG: hypothetical protein JXX14_24475 [Deltaproteobacteria bacterium]|nr:hypothetical protein [Deltaproteobacteria bacterium]
MTDFRPNSVLCCIGLAAIVSVGCAGYAGQVEGMRTALQAGDKSGALKEINKALALDDDDQYPVEVESETSLLLLERASVKQASFMYRESAIDYRIADQNVEFLDVKNNTVGEISKWIFSGDSGIYRAPAHEKLLLNTLNMLNYLALFDLESARVEARRFDLMQQYLADGSDENLRSLGVLGIGDYLAGFTYEMSGRYEQALQHYSDALNVNAYPSLDRVLPELAACTSYRNDDIQKRLDALGAASGEAAATPVGDTDTGGSTAVSTVPICRHPDRETGTILVISSVGLAPHKSAVRLPIGAAVVIAGAYLAPNEMAQANDFAVKGLLKWVNFAELVQSPSRYSAVQVTVDGSGIPSEYGENLSQVVKNSFDKTKGKLVAAAIVRMIARAATGAVTNKAVSSGSGRDGLGLLAQVLVEGAMTVADTPDTRCWNALPASLFISRIEVPAGTHQITVHFHGASGVNNVQREITVQPGGFAVVPVHQLR